MYLPLPVMRSKAAKERDMESTLALKREAYEDSDDYEPSSPSFSRTTPLSGRRRQPLWIVALAVGLLVGLYWFFIRSGTSSLRSLHNTPRPSDISVKNAQPVPVNESGCPDGVACFWKAPSLSPATLMASEAHLSWNRSGSVPRLLHQSWGENPLTSRVKAWSDRCRMLHPEWQWVLWRNEDNRRLVQERFPWLLASFDALDTDIKRADLSRNLYMSEFGGVYLDFDIECVRPFDTLFTSDTQSESKHEMHAYFGRMGVDRDFEHSIPNDWMASSPKHPFFHLLLLIIYQNDKHGSFGPEAETGPIALRNEILRYQKEFAHNQAKLDEYLEGLHIQYKPVAAASERIASITLLDEKIIHPYDWWKGYLTIPQDQADKCLGFKSAFDAESCKELLMVKTHGSYAVAYWAHSWDPSIH